MKSITRVTQNILGIIFLIQVSLGNEKYFGKWVKTLSLQFIINWTRQRTKRDQSSRKWFLWKFGRIYWISCTYFLPCNCTKTQIQTIKSLKCLKYRFLVFRSSLLFLGKSKEYDETFTKEEIQVQEKEAPTTINTNSCRVEVRCHRKSETIRSWLSCSILPDPSHLLVCLGLSQAFCFSGLTHKKVWSFIPACWWSNS